VTAGLVAGAVLAFGADSRAQVLQAPGVGPPPVQCAMPAEGLARVSDPGLRRQMPTLIARLAAPEGSRIAASYHCCDANGCSGPVDLLTICPVIKVECTYTENSCVCNPI
jgi:hypothetical protein